MPMDFPDMKSLIEAAEIHNFRKPRKGESEAEFREDLADHVSKVDFIESEEIRNAIGWDKWTESQERSMVDRVVSKKVWRVK
jgi:hypothetical protein